MINLRHTDPTRHNLAALSARWRRQGYQASLETPPAGGQWVMVREENGAWCGWLNLHDWLEQAAPKLAGIALSAGLEPLVLQWLMACERPVTLPITELTYQRLCFPHNGVTPAPPDKPLLKVSNGQAPLWLEHVRYNGGDSRPLPADLRWSLRFVMGDSVIHLFTLSRIHCADILLIQRPVSHIRCQNKTIGTYQRTEQGIIMALQTPDASADLRSATTFTDSTSPDTPAKPMPSEPFPQDDTATQQDQLPHADQPPAPDSASLPAATTPAPASPDQLASTLNQLPVQLEFVLHRCQMTLAELQALSAQHTLPLPASVETEISVYANGVLLGRGELVQLTDQLGVEIHQWYGEVSHA